VPPGARRIVTVLIAVVALVAIFSVASDLRDVRARLADFGWWAMAAALALALANYAIRFVRWSAYLRVLDIAVPTRESVVVFISGFALSITPGKVGELVKSYLLREIRGVPVVKSAPIVIAERVSDLLALVVLGALGVGAAGAAGSVVALSAGIIGLGLVVLSWPSLSHRLVDILTLPGFLRRFRDRGHTLYDGIGVLVRPRPMLVSTILAVAAWGCECTGFWLVLAAFPGTHVSLGLATLIYSVTVVAGALSFLPGGLGVTEGAMTLLLVQSARGVDNATAVAATVLIRLCTLWFAVGLGLVAMAIARRLSADRSPT